MQNTGESFGGNMENELIIMVGAPGSGKDTVIKENYFENYEVISSDEIRKELYGFEDQTHNKEVFETMRLRTIGAGRSGKNVIYNATNLNRKRRVNLASEMKKYFKKMKLCVVICSIPELFRRNETREERHLPKEKLMDLLKGFQVPTDKEFPYGEIEYYNTSPDTNITALSYLYKLNSYDQHNPHHNETLGLHIQRVALACMSNPKAFIAALYHDLGKPFVRTKDEQGYYHYIGHEGISTYLYIADLMNSINEEVENDLDIALMIEFHDYVFSFDGNFERMKEKMNNKFKGLDEEFWNGMKLLIEADRLRG